MSPPQMTDDPHRKQARSVQTAAYALTSLGADSSSPDQSKPSDDASCSPRHEGVVSAPAPARSPSTDDGGDDNDDPSALSVERKSRVEEDVPMTFPQRLMELLDKEQHSDVVAWLPHGKGFIIYQKKRFATDILPRYFKQAKFTSFTRKLNRWGFQRVSRGAETGAYFHQYFQRGNLRLCMQMCCQSVSKTVPGGARGSGGGSASTVGLPSQPSGPQMCMNSAMDNLRLHNSQAAALVQSPMSAAPSSSFNPTQSLMRLQELQRQQEQLLLQQQQIKQQMAAVAQTLPQLAPTPPIPGPGVPQQMHAAQQPQQQPSPSTPSMMQPQQVPAPAPSHHGEQMLAAAQQQSLLSQQAGMPSAAQQAMAQQQQEQQQQQQGNPSLLAKTPAGSPAMPPQANSSSVYSQSVINAAIEALKRSNSQAYLQMLMSCQGQGKTASNGQGGAIPSNAFQQQLHATVRAQHEQFQQYQQAKHKLLTHHQPGGGAQSMSAGQMQAMAGFAAASGGPSQPSPQDGSSVRKRPASKAKRASAA